MPSEPNRLPCPICKYETTPPRCQECGTEVQLLLCPVGATRLRPIVIKIFCVFLIGLFWVAGVEVMRSHRHSRNIQETLSQKWEENNKMKMYLLNLNQWSENETQKPLRDWKKQTDTFFNHTPQRDESLVEEHFKAICSPFILAWSVLLILVGVAFLRRADRHSWVLTKPRFVATSAIGLGICFWYVLELATFR